MTKKLRLSISFIPFFLLKCVNCALHVAGFIESIPPYFYNFNSVYQIMIGIVLVLVLLFVNIAGVKWVVRLQFVILVILISTILNFTVGLFLKKDPGLFFLFFHLNNVSYSAHHFRSFSAF